MAVFSRASNLLSGSDPPNLLPDGSRWRRPEAGRDVLPVLAYLREGETHTDLACESGIGIRTVYRYVHEGIDLLAAMAPSLE